MTHFDCHANLFHKKKKKKKKKKGEERRTKLRQQFHIFQSFSFLFLFFFREKEEVVTLKQKNMNNEQTKADTVNIQDSIINAGKAIGTAIEKEEAFTDLADLLQGQLKRKTFFCQ
jgi:hypothetical protein